MDTYTASPPAVASRARSTRIASLDVVRGLVMVLMAIDHVRVYAGVPAGGPSAGVFFTRWVTHFCAPAFVFLAGTSAFLVGQKLNDTRKLTRYLVGRGLLLVVLELTVLRIAWTFNFDFAHYLLAGVIWMLGVCMVLLAGLVWLPTPIVGALGALVVVAHNILDVLPLSEGMRNSALWQFLYFGGIVNAGASGPPIAVLYSIVPWIGVMSIGYWFGTVIVREPAKRRRLCLAFGLSAIVAFVVLRALDGYGDPRPWHTASATAPPALFRFLNTTKYPASLLFLLMTLGPAIAVLPLAERAKGVVARTLAVFGQVPLFYYLLHIPLIHALALIVSMIRQGQINPWLFGNHPMMPPPVPAGYMWSLPLLYAVFAVAMVILYVPCRWFADVKARRSSPWLRYL
jgi:uncharacterized membrane protein